LYGLVNKAIQDLVISGHGEQAWTNICTDAGVDTTQFVAMQNYPDAITYGLVGQVSATLGAPPEEVLKAFGRHWVKFTGREGHKDVFEMYPKGKEGLVSFLENLDDMHARMMMAMPELKPPQIYSERLSEDKLRIHYVSHRAGLGPMVTGLLDGLFEYFEVSATSEHLPADAGAGRDHDEFLVEFAHAG